MSVNRCSVGLSSVHWVMIRKHLSGLILAAAVNSYGAENTYIPTTALPPSSGLLNDYLRTNYSPALTNWDIGVNTRIRYEVHDHFAIAGVPGSIDFREHGADVHND